MRDLAARLAREMHIAMLRRASTVPHRPIGPIIRSGKEYVRPAQAARIAGVASSTITRWFQKGILEGFYLKSKRGSRDVLYILKECLTETLLNFDCMVCGKTVKATRRRSSNHNRFCSDKCCNKWWNQKRPVNSNGHRHDRPEGRQPSPY